MTAIFEGRSWSTIFFLHCLQSIFSPCHLYYVLISLDTKENRVKESLLEWRGNFWGKNKKDWIFTVYFHAISSIIFFVASFNRGENKPSEEEGIVLSEEYKKSLLFFPSSTYRLLPRLFIYHIFLPPSYIFLSRLPSSGENRLNEQTALKGWKEGDQHKIKWSRWIFSSSISFIVSAFT